MAHIGIRTSTGSLKTIQTTEAYNDDCKRPGSLTVPPPASIRRLQKAGEPHGTTACVNTTIGKGRTVFSKSIYKTVIDSLARALAVLVIDLRNENARTVMIRISCQNEI